VNVLRSFHNTPAPDPPDWFFLHQLTCKPATGLLLSLLVFSPLLEGGTTHLAVMVIRLMILLLLTLYLIRQIREGAIFWPSLRIDWVVLAYLGLAVLSTLFSPYTHQSVQWLMVLVSYGVLLYLVVAVFETWNDVEKVVAVLAALGLFEATVAVVQRVWFGVLRPSGTFFNPNFLAGYLASVFLIVFGYLGYVRCGRRRLAFVRTPVVPISALLGLFLLAIVWTGSRGGLLALFSGLAVVLMMRFGRVAVVSLTLLTTLVLVVPNPLAERLEAEHVKNPLGYARWQMWQSSVHAMADDPLGAGLGLYQYVYPRYAIPVEGEIARYGKTAQTAHNEYLQMGVDLGVASLVLFWLGVGTIARELSAGLKTRLHRRHRGILVGVAGAGVAILAHAAVDSNLHEPSVAILLAVCVGIILSTPRLCRGDLEPRREIPIRSRPVGITLTLAVIGVLSLLVLKTGLGWVAYGSGSHALERRDTSGAIAAFQTALTLDPGKALYHSSMAAAQFHVFERTHDQAAARTAIAELQRAITLNPLDGHLAGLLGYVYARMASPDSQSDSDGLPRLAWHRAALDAYQSAVELEPRNPFHYFELGRQYHSLGDSQRAEQAVRSAVELEPNFLPGREWLARLYLESGRTQAARLEYQEVIERQRRFVGWKKDEYEERLLRADVAAMTAELDCLGTGS